MRVLIPIDHRFNRTPDGAIWTQTMFTPSYWRRYFEVFDEVKIVARVQPVDRALPGWVQVNTDRISVEPLPYYLGPLEYLLRRQEVLKRARNAFAVGDAVLFYSPNQPALAIRKKLRALKYPYGVYIIANPYDVFPLGPSAADSARSSDGWLPANCDRSAMRPVQQPILRKKPSKKIIHLRPAPIQTTTPWQNCLKIPSLRNPEHLQPIARLGRSSR